MIDVTEYIGLPYKDEGRGPEFYDCWGLLRLVYENRLGVVLPLFTGYEETMTEQTSAMIQEGKDGWSPVTTPEPYDVILFYVNGKVNHITMCIGEGYMLHTVAGRNACVERYTGMLWRRRIEGFYRLDPTS